MTTLEFSVTWDYRCPFARNFCEHVLTGLEAGAPWDVTFEPFSLDQVHVAEGEADVWERPDKAPGLLVMQAGIAVRDGFPESFPRAHHALFAARHEHALDLRQRDVDPGGAGRRRGRRRRGHGRGRQRGAAGDIPQGPRAGRRRPPACSASPL